MAVKIGTITNWSGWATGSFTWDAAAPTASFSTTPTSPTGATALGYGVTFSETVTGLASSDFAVSGSATGWSVAVGSPTGTVYPVTLTGGTSGTVSLTLAANAVTDALGNQGPASATAAPTVTVDRTAPALTAGGRSASPTGGTALSFTITGNRTSLAAPSRRRTSRSPRRRS